MKFKFFLLVLIINVIFAGCAGSSSSSKNPGDATVAVTGVSLNKTTTNILVGGTEQLTANITPGNSTNQNITWVSSNSSKATVSSSGLVTGVAVGSVIVTVQTTDGSFTATCNVTIAAATVSVTGITLNKTSTSIGVGNNEQLITTITPNNATNQNVTWSTSDSSKATVSSSGLVTGVATGTSAITVTTADGTLTAMCNVTVLDITPPTVLNTIPADGAKDIVLNSSFSMTFSEIMNPSTLSVQASDGACSGNIQISSDNFTTCLGGTISTSGNPVIVWTPASKLWISQNYKVRITTNVQDSGGNALASDDTRSFTTQDVSTWVFVDGNKGNGINKDISKGATSPKATQFNNKLYITWNENNGTSTQIRVVVFNGNDSKPGWTFVDGNGINGINKNSVRPAFSSRLIVFNSKLYCCWIENNGSATQVRVAVYNGNDSSPVWTFVDDDGTNGINKDSTKNAAAVMWKVVGTKLYIAWQEMNATAIQIRAAVYNGNDSSPVWTFIDGNGANGINKNNTMDASVPLLTSFNNKLYATWYEKNSSAITQIRASVYNGNDSSPAWTFVDGNGIDGLNKDYTKNALVSLLTAFNNKLYISWYESDSNNVTQVRAAVYGGDDAAPTWSFIDGNGSSGLNKDITKNAVIALMYSISSKLYMTWKEDNSTSTQNRVAVYNGSDSSPAWTFVDGNGTNGINYNPAMSTTLNQSASILNNFNGKVYAIWAELNPSGLTQIRVAVGATYTPFNVTQGVTSQGISKIWKAEKNINEFFRHDQIGYDYDNEDRYLIFDDTTATIIGGKDIDKDGVIDKYMTYLNAKCSYTYNPITKNITLSNAEGQRTLSINSNNKVIDLNFDGGNMYIFNNSSSIFNQNISVWPESDQMQSEVIDYYSGTRPTEFIVNSLSASYASTTKTITVTYNITSKDSRNISWLVFRLVSPSIKNDFESYSGGQHYQVSPTISSGTNVNGSFSITFNGTMLPENGVWDINDIIVGFDTNNSFGENYQYWQNQQSGNRISKYLIGYEVADDWTNSYTGYDVVTFTVNGGIDTITQTNLSSVTKSGNIVTVSFDSTITGKAWIFFASSTAAYNTIRYDPLANAGISSPISTGHNITSTSSITYDITSGGFGSGYYISKILFTYGTDVSVTNGTLSHYGDEYSFSGVRKDYYAFPVDMDTYHNNTFCGGLVDFNFFYEVTNREKPVKTNISIIPAW